jgi:ribosomal protein S18 acetylase RimI-like enzyme
MSSYQTGYEKYPASAERISELSDVEDYGDILLRGFRDADDEQQMRELVFNNAFLGRPFDAICPCKEWFGDVVLGPYIKLQPDNVHVAVHKPSGRLIGYLTGSLGGKQFEKDQYERVRRQVVSLAVKLSIPWSFFDHASRSFATHVIFKGESERPDHPQSGAHWHFQVDKDFRGQGVGSMLLQRFTNDALEAGFESIWAEVMAYDEKPPEYFEALGWEIYDAKPTTIFGDLVDFPVQTLCVTKPLSAFETPLQAA